MVIYLDLWNLYLLAPEMLAGAARAKQNARAGGAGVSVCVAQGTLRRLPREIALERGQISVPAGSPGAETLSTGCASPRHTAASALKKHSSGIGASPRAGSDRRARSAARL